MRFLIISAGAVGGYFGGRLAEKGEDVTFLVRENRQKQLNENGLVIKSIHGDTILENPKTIRAGEETERFDVVLLGTKAYHLSTVIQDIKLFIHNDTMIIPMLNGMKHMDMLLEEFSDDQVMGGLCFIESTLDEDGAILQSSPIHEFVFGERTVEQSERVARLEQAFKGVNASMKSSQHIMKDMWHKYMFISALSGVTTLFKSAIGPIREAEGGSKLIKQLFTEIATIMRHENAPISDGIEEVQIAKISDMTYEMKSSMLRDMEKGASVEADHLQGYLLELADKHQLETTVLQAVYTNLKVYEL
ncbi:ketopantoate reductase family protein [Metabacillus arenae]|uniref:2-dehydropantoate 2-reductase n=1 Tax=Metabacillus arenae TaxID=2771434 RepID=A0A926NHG9_9BACI|nr:ketopantoate reductase family protein [Metabacillus arenae]MBD1381356.1 ketopantoate reductase family protein [Metabacillus arenae]